MSRKSKRKHQKTCSNIGNWLKRVEGQPNTLVIAQGLYDKLELSEEGFSLDLDVRFKDANGGL